MKKRQLGIFASAIGLGIVAAVIAAPHLNRTPDVKERLHAQFAHNYPSLNMMAQDVDAVILGTVVDVRPGRSVITGDGQAVLPFTEIDIEVDNVILGEADKTITVEQTGGDVNDLSIYFDGGGGPYDIDRQVLLFVKEQTDTGMYYVAHPKGRFDVSGNALRAVVPDDNVAGSLDGKDVRTAIGIIRNAG